MTAGLHKDGNVGNVFPANLRFWPLLSSQLKKLQTLHRPAPPLCLIFLKDAKKINIKKKCHVTGDRWDVTDDT